MARVFKLSARVGSILLLIYGVMSIISGFLERSELENAGWFSTTMYYVDHFGFGPVMLLCAINLWMFSRTIKPGEPSE